MAEEPGLVKSVWKKGNGWLKWGSVLIMLLIQAVLARDQFRDLGAKVNMLDERMIVVEKIPNLEMRTLEMERRIAKLELTAEQNQSAIRSIDSKQSEMIGMLRTHMAMEKPK